MKRRLLTLLLCLLVGLFAADRIGALLMEQVARHTQDVLGPKLRSLGEGVDADVVLLGASRSHHHYVPTILSDTLGMSVYNAGVGGSNNIYSHYLVLCHILQHHTPRVVCLELMTTDFVPQPQPYNALSFFAPLFGRCAEADSVYRQAGIYWRYKVSHLYRYNAKAASNLIGLVMNRQRQADCGYIPLPKPATQPSEAQPEPAATGCDSLKLACLQRFVDRCRERHISVVFTVSPKLTIAPEGQYDVLKALARKNGIPFLDYHTTRLFHDHSEYFKDESHLWDEGARLFSKIVASDLLKLKVRSEKCY